MLRRISACGLALLVLLPGPAARADEGDLSFVALIGGGLMLLSGSAFCFVQPSEEPGPFATRSFYGGLGMSYAHDNFQTKGGGSPFDPGSVSGSGGGLVGRRFAGRNEDEGQLTDFDALDPRVPEDPPAPVGSLPTGNQDRPEPTGAIGVDPNGKPLPIYGAPNGILGETRPDAEDGPLGSAISDGGAFGADAVLSTKVEDGAAWGINGRLGFRCHPRAALEAHFEWLGEDFDLSFDTVGLQRSDPGNPLNGQTEMHFRHATVDSDLWTAGANARFFLMTGRVQPYVLGGLGIMRLKESTVRYDLATTSPTATEACPQELVRPVIPIPTAGGDANTDPNRLLPSTNCSYISPAFLDSDQFKDIDLAARFGGGLEVYVTDQLSLNLEGAYVRPSGRVEGYDYYSLSAGVLFRFGGGLFRDAATN